MNGQPNLPNRIRLSQSASDQLGLLKTRTGLTPNILARIAFSYSLRADFDYQQLTPAADGLEFNLVTLLGDYSSLYELLLFQDSQASTSEELSNALISHIENGLTYMMGTKRLTDLATHCM